jgi:branched-chain amino acid transport system permease protein
MRSRRDKRFFSSLLDRRMENAPILRRGFAAVLCIVLLLAPLATNDYTQYVLNLVLIYVVIGIGLNFLLGYAGQFAFAHAALMGIGAYTTALLSTRLHISFWICLPLSGAVAAAIGAAGALPAMRMRRVYLALVTLAFAQLIVWVLVNWNSVTLGTDGVDVHAPYFFGIRLHGDKRIFYVILPVTALMFWLARRILESHIGRSFVAIRENEIVARCNGIDIARTKTVVFALSAFYAGVGGALYALALGFIVPDSFGLSQLVLHFSIVVLVGLHTRFLAASWRAMGGRHEADAQQAVEAVLEFLGIGSKLLTPVSELTFADQRLTEIARAIVTRPRLLLLDEPAAGLSPNEVEEFGHLLHRLRDEWHMTILLVEHVLSLVMDRCDRITVLENGRKIAEGLPDAVANDPAVQLAYLGTDDA